jgi:hypothetical protein
VSPASTEDHGEEPDPASPVAQPIADDPPDRQ